MDEFKYNNKNYIYIYVYRMKNDLVIQETNMHTVSLGNWLLCLTNLGCDFWKLVNLLPATSSYQIFLQAPMEDSELATVSASQCVLAASSGAYDLYERTYKQITAKQW